jgi:hypothetical protein
MSDDADRYVTVRYEFRRYFKAEAAVTALHDTIAIAAVNVHKGGHETVQGNSAIILPCHAKYHAVFCVFH